MAINIDYLSHNYFIFDSPVPYKLKDGKIINIVPISLRDSEKFLSCFDILGIDKNSYPDVKIIRMSYLQFVSEILLADEENGSVYSLKLGTILDMCLGMKNSNIYSSDGEKYYIKDNDLNIQINEKEFDDIKKIILHQNILRYDDSYVNPELKQAMNEVDELRNKNISSPSLERKIAIITAHCGISKKEQIDMTYRSHSLLFEEVCGEVEFSTTRNAMLISGNSKEIEHWIYRKKKDRFDGYVTTVDSYTKQIGGNQAIRSFDTSQGDFYSQQFNNFNKK